MKYTFQLYKLVTQNQFQEQESMDHKMRIIFGFCTLITSSISRHLKLKSIAHLISPLFRSILTNVILISELQAHIRLYSH